MTDKGMLEILDGVEDFWCMEGLVVKLMGREGWLREIRTHHYCLCCLGHIWGGDERGAWFLSGMDGLQERKIVKVCYWGIWTDDQHGQR